MKTEKKEAMVVPSGEGKKMNVVGHRVTVKLAHQETNGEYYVFEVLTPAGHGIPPHVHKKEDEMIQVIEGEFEIMLGEQTYQAKPGALIHFPRNIPHSFRNVASTAGKTLWTVVPGANFEKFFDEMGALPADGPPDLGKVAEIFNKYDISLMPPPAA